jgi:carboxymethylenebutenolidase
MDHMNTDSVDGLIHLYEDGALSRRELVRRVAAYTGSMAAAMAVLKGVLAPPRAAAATSCLAQVQVPEGSPDMDTQPVEFPGPGGTVFGYLATPRDTSPLRVRHRGLSPQPGVLVIHENIGLTEHIKDVTRRVARAGYVALGVDLLSRVGGTSQFPDSVQAGAAYNRVGRQAFLEDMLAALAYLKGLSGVRPDRLGAVGFCAGGGNCFNLAVNTTDLAAAVVFYGTPVVPIDQVDKLPPVLCNYAELDRALTGQMSTVMSALLDRRKTFAFHVYEGANHAFHNDTGPRYDPAAACDAWSKTLAFFNVHLRGATP